MKAILRFNTRQMAQDFTVYWGRKTLTGHDMSASGPCGETFVTVYDVDDAKRALIDDYIQAKNA